LILEKIEGNKKNINRIQKKVEKYKVRDKVLISIKNFLMKLIKKVMKKLIKKYIKSYTIKKIVSENVIELELLMLLRIHLIVNCYD